MAMRPLHLREWPVFHALTKLGHATPSDVLRALVEDQPADLHSVRATLQGFADAGYARVERSHQTNEDGARVEVVTYYPAVEPEEALRVAWPELREVMLDRGRYLEAFREVVGVGD